MTKWISKTHFPLKPIVVVILIFSTVAMAILYNLQNVLNKVARHYITRALKMTNHKKVDVAKMVGFKNYQTLTNWSI